MTAMLKLESVSAFYGPMKSLHEAALHVEQGEIVVLVGANGAGKSTLLRAISGVVQRSGAISFLGERIDRLEPEEIVRRGIVHVPEGRRIFPGMTVRENLEVGGAAVGRRSASIRQGIEEALTYFPRLKERIASYGWSLSGGEQQMLAVGRGLMAQPKISDAGRAVARSRPAHHAGSLRDHPRYQREWRADAVGRAECRAGVALWSPLLRHGDWAHREGWNIGGHGRRSGDCQGLSRRLSPVDDAILAGSGRQAAVDRCFGPGNEAAFIRQEKQDQIGDVVDGAGATERNALLSRLEMLA